MQEVQGLADQLGALATLNLAVCSPFYSSMMEEASSASAAGAANSV